MATMTFWVRAVKAGTLVATSGDGTLVVFGDSVRQIRERLMALVTGIGDPPELLFEIGRPRPSESEPTPAA